MFHPFAQATLLCTALLSRSACVALPARARETVATRALAPVFELYGRLSASDGKQAASGQLEWRHAHATDSFTLLTPLGQIVAQLDADALGARLHTADGQVLAAESAAILLPRVLGIDVPAARLSHWVQAAPDTSAEVRQRDTRGRPTLVIDQGWRIEYLDYRSTDTDAPPTRLDISRGDAHIRLIIDSWTSQP